MNSEREETVRSDRGDRISRNVSTIRTAHSTHPLPFLSINNFVVYRVAATTFLVLFFFIAAFALPPSRFAVRMSGDAPVPSYFQLVVIQLILLVLLNDIVFTTIGRDNVRVSPRPTRWNLRASFAIAFALAAVPLAACLLALWASLDSHAPGSLFARMGLPGMPFEKIEVNMWFLISVMSFLTLFSARERGPFWSSAPHWLLASASAASLVVTTLLACFWPPSVLTGIPLLGLARTDAVSNYTLWPVWSLLYCGLVFVLQDAVKVGTWKLIDRFDLFHYRTGAFVAARATHDFGDGDTPVDAATGAVEGRLLEYRSKMAANALARASVVDATLAPRAASVEAAVREIASERVRRFSAASAPADVETGGGAGGGGAAGGVAAFERAVADADADAALPADLRRVLEADLLGVRSADAALESVLAAREEQQQRGRRKG